MLYGYKSRINRPVQFEVARQLPIGLIPAGLRQFLRMLFFLFPRGASAIENPCGAPV